MTQKALQVRDQQTLEMIVGIPVAWTKEEVRDEAEKALAVRKEAIEMDLSEQADLQENFLQTLAFLNELDRRIENISVKPLEGHYDLYPLDTELIPFPGLEIVAIAESMPHPIKIEEWKILKPSRRRIDPDLAFRVAGRWYSVLHWD